MRKSTKILLVLYIILMIPAVIFGGYIFKAIKPTGQTFEFDLSLFAILGITFNVLAMIVGTILFFRFINSRSMDKAIFFSSFPLVVAYGVALFFLAQISSYQNDTARTVSSLLNISADNNYNTILWAVLISLVFILLLFFNFIILCRPVSRMEKIVARLGDGKVKDKIKLGGVKQFETIEHNLNKINDNYREKDKNLTAVRLESEKYIPKQFFRFLGKNNISQLELGRQVKKNATTTLIKLSRSAQRGEMSLEENFHFVNSYMNVISPLIRKFGGFIDKYLGEGVVAVFSSSQEALDCIHTVERAIDIKNRQNKTLPNVVLRSTIANGEVVFGIIGEMERKIPTIVSGIENNLEKLDEIAKLISAKSLFGKEVIDSLPLHYRFSYRLVGKITQENGKEEFIFEDLDVYPKDTAKLLIKTKSIFEKGVMYYSNGQYQQSCRYMQQTLQENPADRCAYVYFNKCKDKIGQLA